jgi:hypothetical protein
MFGKHLKSHPVTDSMEHDLTAQKLFVAVCAAASGVVLYRVAQEINAAKLAGIIAIIAGLTYAARQCWKLAASRF